MTRKKELEPSPSGAAELIWFDPGTTTGVCRVSLDPAWLDGTIAPTFAAFRRAVYSFEHAQLGRYAREAEHFTKGSPEAELALLNTGQSSAVWQELCAVEGGLDIIRRWPFAAWGYEDFHCRMISGAEDFLSPARVGSSLRDQMLMSFPPRVPFMQMPALALDTVTDARLQAAGLYRRGMRHANDAARHVVTFYRRARTDPELREQAWPHLFGASK